MTTAGTKTVTISYTENEVEKTTSYTIEVKAAAALESITLSGTYPTEFTQGGVFSSEGIVVTANYDDETTKDVTEEAAFSGYDMSATGKQTVTVSYGGKTATYEITVNKYVIPSELIIDFESALSTYKEWTFTNAEQGTGSITAHGGTCYGTTGGKATAAFQTKEKIANPGTFTCYVSKQSTNTTASTWYIQVSSDGSSWKEVKSQSATSMNKGEWVEFTADLSTYSDVYVRLYYSGSTAVRNVDDITLDMATPKILSSIALSGEYPTTFHIGDAFSHEGMTVTATYESGKTADVTASATFSGYDMATAGTQTVTVSYAEGEVTKIATYDITINAPAALSSITLSGTYTTEFGQGDEFSSEGIVVTANYDDDTTSDVTGRATFSGYDMATLGEQTVTVTYEGKTATYIITVVEKKGTATNPYTVAEARAAIDAGTGLTGVYATGIISQVDSYNSDYNSITYWISSDGTTTSDQLQVYSGKGLNNTNFSSVNDVAVGATVVIYGTLKKYNSTYEFDKNNYLTSYTEPVVAVETPTFSPEPGVYTEAQTVTITCDTEGATIMYCFDGQEWQEYPENGILLSEYKTYIIHAKAEKGSDVSRYAEATYTINDPNAPGSANQPYTVAEAVAAVDAGTGITGVYVTGIISQVDSYQNSKYITYWISADGTTESQQFEVYKGLGIDGAAFSSKDDLQVGDEVVVKGNITLYNSSTYEFVVDNQLVSLKRKQTVTLSFEKPEYTATLDETFTAPTLTVTNAATGEAISGLTITYSYESFGNLPIELNLTTGEVTLKEPGEATVIATFAGNDDYKPATASYKLTVTSNKAATNLVIDQLTSTTLNVGDKIQLDYTTNGDGDITWKSSNENVLTVDQQGNVTAVAAGKATITITQSETEAYQAGEATIELTVVDPNQGEYLWLLAEASYSSASEDQVTWTSDYATMVLKKDKSQQNANSYLGGDENKRTSSRFYTDQILTITRVEGYRIASVLFQATTENYATTFKNSTWTNVAEPTLDSKSVILTPTDGMEPIVATIGGTCGFDKVLVTYVKTDEVVKPVPSLAFVDAANMPITKIELVKDDTFTATLSTDLSSTDEILISIQPEGIVSYDNNIITALDAGEATITATFAGNDSYKPASAQLKVVVSNPAEPVNICEINGINPTSLTINETAQFTLDATFVEGLTLGVDYEILWESSDPTILDVHSNGLAVANGVGTAEVTVKVKEIVKNEADKRFIDMEKTFTVTVYGPATQVQGALIAKLADDTYRAVTNDATSKSNWLVGREVTVINGKVLASENDSDISWTITTRGDVTTFQDLDGKFISAPASGNYIGLADAASESTQWTVDGDSWTKLQGENQKTILWNNANQGFRYYASSNIGNSGYSSAITYSEIVPGCTRTLSNTWGTVCFSRQVLVENTVNARFYWVAGKVLNEAGEPVKLILREEDYALKTGYPFIVEAIDPTAPVIMLFEEGELVERALNMNGLYGTHTETEVPEGAYILSGGQFVKCGTGCTVAADRAYLKMEKVPEYEGDEAGVKVFNLDGEDGISSLNAATEGAVIYDLSGRRVSKTAKGLYIINGKKVSVK